MATSNSKSDSGARDTNRTATTRTDSNRGTGASTTDAEAPVPTTPDDMLGVVAPADVDKRDEMSDADLRAEAKRRDLPTDGGRIELLARLRSADVAEQRKKAIKGNPFLGDRGRIDVDATLTAADRVRTLVQEVERRIDEEVTQHLLGLETLVDDPNSGAVVAGSRRMRAHIDDVRRALRALSAAAASLGQDAVV